MSMTRHISGHIKRFDEDEGGAILLACLAGCLIVFMVSLTMYDAGNVTREKIKLQTATDAAAYSQASVKARTMNTNAYINVTKRSIMGIQLTYFTAQNYFFSDMWARFNACKPPNSPPAAVCNMLYKPVPCNSSAANSTSSNSCLSGNQCCNIIITTKEYQTDFGSGTGASTAANFGGDTEFGSRIQVCTVNPDPNDPNSPPECSDESGDPSHGLFIVANFNAQRSSLEAAKLYGAMDKYTKEMRQLTRYQEYMQTITPWWAFSEALTRATFNGATMATAYPPPAWFDASSPAGNYPTGASPEAQMEEDWKFPTSAGLVSGRNHASLATQFDSFAGHICSQFTGGSDSSQPFADPLFNEEVEIHVATLKRNSDGEINTSDTYARQIFAADDLTSPLKTIGGYSACFMMNAGRYTTCTGVLGGNELTKPTKCANKSSIQSGDGALPLIDPTYSTPYLVSVDPTNSELDRMRLSNIVFGYKEGSDYRRDTDGSGTGMTRFEYMTQNYSSSLPQEAQGTGIWTMARGEIVTLGDSDGNWHAAWTARVRPIARPGELSAVESDMSIPSGGFMNNAFRAAIPYLRVNAQIAHTSGEHHQEVWQSETTTMERATKAMDSDSSRGFFK